MNASGIGGTGCCSGCSALHVPGLAVLGVLLGRPPLTVGAVLLVPLVAVGLGDLLTRAHRRTASVIVTFGLVYCSAALVAFTDGRIEAHFHFFIIIGFIALYQDWAPFLLNIVFTVISHGIGSAWQRDLIFDHASGQANPWLWSLIHGVAVLFACVGMMLFWRVTEDSQEEKDRLSHQLSDAEIGRRQFTSDLLTNLARRNQSLLYRQLDIINQLEESERDPDALAELFRLDHIATRVRRNAENLLVLSGEQPPRTWSDPVPLRDVLRAAIAETEDLSRVVIVVDEQTAVVGHAVTDLTHLMAELTENAVRFSPPDTTVTVRSRPDPHEAGGWLLTVEDWGIGMAPDVLAATNALLADAPELDMSVSQRLGFHVVARLAARHGIHVSLSPTPGSGATALVRLPSSLTTSLPVNRPEPVPITSRAPVTDRAAGPGGIVRAPATARGHSPLPQPAPRSLCARRTAVRGAFGDPFGDTCGGASGTTAEARPWELRSWDGWWAPPVTGENEEAPDTAAAPTPPQPQPRTTAPQPRCAPQSRTAAPPAHDEPDGARHRTDAAHCCAAATHHRVTAVHAAPQPRTAAPTGAAGPTGQPGRASAAACRRHTWSSSCAWTPAPTRRAPRTEARKPSGKPRTR